MKKEIAAIFAALGITSAIGLSILILGLNVIFNNRLNTHANTTGSNSAALVSSSTGSTQGAQQGFNQYAAELEQTQQQLAAANGQIQQYQRLVSVLVQRGIIQVSADGTIYIQQSK